MRTELLSLSQGPSLTPAPRGLASREREELLPGAERGPLPEKQDSGRGCGSGARVLTAAGGWRSAADSGPKALPVEAQQPG